jgi:hypothetical protein
MPSARKRRLRKLIKGSLTSKDDQGAFQDGDGTVSAQQSIIASITVKPKGPEGTAGTQGEAWSTLLGLQVSAGLPTTSNPDVDGASTGNDFLPFDAREEVDTDGDGIGDNRDILLTKLSLDGIFFEKLDGGAGPETGTLYDSISSEESLEEQVSIVVALPQGNPGEIAAKKSTLLSLQTVTDEYTLTGLASLETKIVAEKASGVNLLSSIAEMSATGGVKIDDAPFYNQVPYNEAGGSETAFNDAALMDVVTPANSAVVVIDSMEIAVDSIESL